MNDRVAAASSRGTFRVTITGIGCPGPIEERLGRRLVRIVDPGSKEGAALLRTGQVTFLGPRGATLGRVDLDQARRLLKHRLLGLLATVGGDADAEALRDGLVRLRRAAPRVGRA